MQQSIQSESLIDSLKSALDDAIQLIDKLTIQRDEALATAERALDKALESLKVQS